MGKNKSVRHPADKYAEKWLTRYPNATALSRELCEQREDIIKVDGTPWPDWCGLPMAAVYSIVDAAHGPELKEEQTKQRMWIGGGIGDVAPLTASILWASHKNIYRFDSELLAMLREQPLESIPVDALLTMPHHCIFVEAELSIFNAAAFGMFAWMECDPHTAKAELRMIFLHDNAEDTPVTLILEGGTIQDSLQAWKESALARALYSYHRQKISTMKFAPSYEDELRVAVNILLYLSAENADVPPMPDGIARSKDSMGNPKRSRVWDVGIRVGRAMRQYRTEQATAPSDGGGVRNAPRPHVRRAHWHHFWTGPKAGPRKLVLRWLPPIPVNVDDAELPAVINIVRQK